METLREIFEGLGFANAATLLASGNVIFDAASKNAAALEQRLEETLGRELGFDTPVILRTLAQLKAALAHPALAARSSYTSVNVAFTRPAVSDAGRAALAKFETGSDWFHVAGGEVIWLSRLKQSESEFSNNALEKAAKVQSTIRTVQTVEKILDKYGR